MHDMEAHQAERLAHTLTLRRPTIRQHGYDCIDGVEFALLRFRIENLPRHLDNDPPGVAALDLALGRIFSRRKVNLQLGILFALLLWLAVELVLLDVVEHLPVHQDIEQRIISLLIDQRAGPKWLVVALLDYFDAHVGIGLELVFAFWRSFLGVIPFRCGSVRQHHVEQLLEVLPVLPHGFRIRHGFVDSGASVGGRIQSNKREP